MGPGQTHSNLGVFLQSQSVDFTSKDNAADELDGKPAARKSSSMYMRGMLRGQFSAGSKIGDGAYGTVFKVEFKDSALEQRVTGRAQSQNKTKFALKEMLIHRFINEGRIKEVFIERSILASLDHPSIIKFYQSFKNQNKLFLLVEFCPRGSLMDFLKRQGCLNNVLAQHLTAEIVLALEYLRSMQIVHRDLKPGNIVLDANYHIKLIDFATCKVYNPAIQAKIAAFQNKNDLLRSMGFNDDTDLSH